MINENVSEKRTLCDNLVILSSSYCFSIIIIIYIYVVQTVRRTRVYSAETFKIPFCDKNIIGSMYLENSNWLIKMI